jgi:hypothetical protein
VYTTAGVENETVDMGSRRRHTRAHVQYIFQTSLNSDQAIQILLGLHKCGNRCPEPTPCPHSPSWKLTNSYLTVPEFLFSRTPSIHSDAYPFQSQLIFNTIGTATMAIRAHYHWFCSGCRTTNLDFSLGRMRIWTCVVCGDQQMCGSRSLHATCYCEEGEQ